MSGTLPGILPYDTRPPKRRYRPFYRNRSVLRFLSGGILLFLIYCYIRCSPYVCPPRARNPLSRKSGYPREGSAQADTGRQTFFGGKQAKQKRVEDQAPLGYDTAPKNIHTKSLVVASMRGDDTSWLYQYFDDWDINIFVMNDPNARLTVAKNKGRESMAYLTFLIDNYHDLPEYMVFLHSLRYQWHNEDPMYDGVPPLRNLQLSYVNKVGYSNMRCSWTIGCPSEIRPEKMITQVEAAFEADNERANTEAAFSYAFRQIFPGEDVPDAVGINCGAQFALSRWKVLERPREDYIRYRDWLYNTPLKDSASGSSVANAPVLAAQILVTARPVDRLCGVQSVFRLFRPQVLPFCRRDCIHHGLATLTTCGDGHDRAQWELDWRGDGGRGRWLLGWHWWEGGGGEGRATKQRVYLDSLERPASSAVSQIAVAIDDSLFNTYLDVRAVLLVARNRSGPARIVACYPAAPADYDEDEEGDGAGIQGEEDDDDEASVSRALFSMLFLVERFGAREYDECSASQWRSAGVTLSSVGLTPTVPSSARASEDAKAANTVSSKPANERQSQDAEPSSAITSKRTSARGSGNSDLVDAKPSKDVIEAAVKAIATSSEPITSSPHSGPSKAATKRMRSSKTSRRDRKSKVNNLDNTLFGLPKDALARLLAPSSKMAWDMQKLDLRIRDHTFVGCPVFVDPPRFMAAEKPSEQEQHKDSERIAHDEGDVEPEQVRSRRASNGISTSLQASPAAENPDPDHDSPGPSHAHSANVSTPTASPVQIPGVAAQQARIGADSRDAEPHASSTATRPSESIQSGTSFGSLSSENDRRLNPLAIFNVVSVISCPAQKVAKQTDLYHTHISRSLAAWLKKIQQNRGWIDRQIRKIEQFQASGASERPADRTKESSAPVNEQSPVFTSGVERLLQSIYTGLKNDGALYLELGKHRETLSLKLPRVSSAPYVAATVPSSSAQPRTNAAIRSSMLTASGTLGPAKDQQSKEDPDKQRPDVRQKIDYKNVLDELGIETNEPLSISQHSSLVFISERKDLIAQLQPSSAKEAASDTASNVNLASIVNSSLTQPFIYFIQNMSYRRTLTQLTEPSQPNATAKTGDISKTSAVVAASMPGLTLRDAQVFACILIRVGAARASFPLHASNTYIVNPLAPTANLLRDSAEWDVRFGEAQDGEGPHVRLPEILRALSQGAAAYTDSRQTSAEQGRASSAAPHPKPWASIIPSKDIKMTYMDMLAWLVARNWVIQIRTFAYVKVSGEVKQAVRQKSTHSRHPSESQDTPDGKTESAFEARPHRSLLSNLISTSRPTSAAGSTGSTRTALKVAGSVTSRRSSHEEATRPSTPLHVGDEANVRPSLVRSPARATAEEQQWLDHIGAHLADEEARLMWPTLVRYLDGTHALEEIAAMVGWKRAVLARVVKKLVAADVIKTVRHW
ncbi:MAG: hypothetical protein Q9159_001356 [Coniocarpon cinnabarinum]